MHTFVFLTKLKRRSDETIGGAQNVRVEILNREEYLASLLWYLDTSYPMDLLYFLFTHILINMRIHTYIAILHTHLYPHLCFNRAAISFASHITIFIHSSYYLIEKLNK